jgi:hypothetical protein
MAVGVIDRQTFGQAVPISSTYRLTTVLESRQ